MRKILILDIDGVLNPFDGHANPKLSKTPVTATHSIYVDLNIIREFLRNLLESHVEIVWGSAWEENSNLLQNILELPEPLRFIPIQHEDVGLGTWKLKSIKSWVESNLHKDDILAWVDDELEEDAHDWALNHGSTLAITTDSFVGLTQNHIQRIYAFLDSNLRE